MVKKLSMFFAYVIFFILALMYFTPKVSLYYMLEKELTNYEVVLSDESVNDSGFALHVESVNVYVKGIDSANVESITLKVFGLYNSLVVENIRLSSVASNFIPINISEVSISYSIFDPLHVKISGSGGFGEASGSVHVLDRILNIKITPSNEMQKKYRNSISKLTKNEDGSYSYVKTF